MALDIEVQAKIPFLARFRPERLDAATRATIYPAIDEAVMLLTREVKSRTPVGATEAARGSIQGATEIVRGRRLDVRGTVTSALPYVAGPLEFGSRPHWAPIAPLKLWAKRILGDESAAWAVRAAIAKRGTRPRRMFRDGFAAAEGRIKNIMQAGVDAWTRRLKR